MYDYKLIFDIYINNNVIEEKVLTAQKCIKQLQNMQNMLMQQ